MNTQLLSATVLLDPRGVTSVCSQYWDLDNARGRMRKYITETEKRLKEPEAHQANAIALINGIVLYKELAQAAYIYTSQC
jgi:hypothetical protein